mmetsp:Transcript_29495/g.78004  ORF Transcript_29495/g.78004 Transcript_29495/m.78004 type:complete len:80 (-) Transcript_29495:761-1000(-)
MGPQKSTQQPRPSDSHMSSDALAWATISGARCLVSARKDELEDRYTPLSVLRISLADVRCCSNIEWVTLLHASTHFATV